jgi:hypothetical protein
VKIKNLDSHELRLVKNPAFARHSSHKTYRFYRSYKSHPPPSISDQPKWNKTERFRSKTERPLVPWLTSPLSRPNYFVIKSFCHSLAARNQAVLTSSLSGPHFQNRQGSHLLEPQPPSRVVKAGQASQKTTPSSLDVKAPLPACHNQTTSGSTDLTLRLPVRHSFSEGGCASAPLRLKNSNPLRTSQDCAKHPSAQIVQPQPPFNLVKPRKTFKNFAPLNLARRPSLQFRTETGAVVELWINQTKLE